MISHAMMFTRIDQLKARLDAHRPLPAATLASLREDLILRWTYHSNAIEGNTLTLNETLSITHILIQGAAATI